MSELTAKCLMVLQKKAPELNPGRAMLWRSTTRRHLSPSSKIREALVHDVELIPERGDVSFVGVGAGGRAGRRSRCRGVSGAGGGRSELRDGGTTFEMRTADAQVVTFPAAVVANRFAVEVIGCGVCLRAADLALVTHIRLELSLEVVAGEPLEPLVDVRGVNIHSARVAERAGRSRGCGVGLATYDREILVQLVLHVIDHITRVLELLVSLRSSARVEDDDIGHALEVLLAELGAKTSGQVSVAETGVESQGLEFREEFGEPAITLSAGLKLV